MILYIVQINSSPFYTTYIEFSPWVIIPRDPCPVRDRSDNPRAGTKVTPPYDWSPLHRGQVWTDGTEGRSYCFWPMTATVPSRNSHLLLLFTVVYRGQQNRQGTIQIWSHTFFDNFLPPPTPPHSFYVFLKSDLGGASSSVGKGSLSIWQHCTA